MGPRRTILHRLASAITIHPAFDGRPRTLEPGSDLGNRDAVVNDELSNPQTSAWSQSCVSVGHKRAFLAVDIFASPTQPARPSPTSHARITILQPTSPLSTPRQSRCPVLGLTDINADEHVDLRGFYHPSVMDMSSSKSESHVSPLHRSTAPSNLIQQSTQQDQQCRRGRTGRPLIPVDQVDIIRISSSPQRMKESDG